MTDPAGPCFVIFGVSGVGKSTLCERFVQAHPDYIYARASTLLQQATKSPAEQLRRSSPGQIVEHQSLLGPALHQVREGKWWRPVVLDAHAVIDNDQTLIPVPVEAIAALSPTALFLLQSDASQVIKRRSGAQRKRPERTLEQVEEELRAERRTVEHFAASLGIPLKVLADPTPEALEAAIICVSTR